MAKSLFNRLVLLFKSSAHEALDAAQDPGALARQLVRELATEIARTEEGVSIVLGDLKALIAKRDQSKEEAADWNSKAALAVAASRDDLATAALVRAERAERNLAAFEQSVTLLSPKVDALKAKLEALRKRKNDAESDAAVLTARASAATATSRAARLLGSIGDNPVDFDDVRDRVAHMEAHAEALNDLAADSSGAGLEAELAGLSTSSVEDRLATLKAQAKAGAQ